MLTYAQGHDLLKVLIKARTAYDGDQYTDLFAQMGEVVLDPFAPPLVGHNDLRAYLLQSAEAERYFDLTIERHWVSGATVLAAWHASWTRRSDGAKVREAGFLAAETGDDGRIERLKQWTVTREHVAD